MLLVRACAVLRGWGATKMLNYDIARKIAGMPDLGFFRRLELLYLNHVSHHE